MESAQILSFADLEEGATSNFHYVITEDVYQNFLRAFDDRSPVHVDADYAKNAGFRGTVMHGAILHGFLSHFVGMVLPGAASLLLSAELRFLQPSYLGDKLRLEAKIAQKMETHQAVVLHVSFFNESQGYVAANGRVQVKVRSM